MDKEQLFFMLGYIEGVNLAYESKSHAHDYQNVKSKVT